MNREEKADLMPAAAGVATIEPPPRSETGVIDLSVIIPIYNEQEKITRTVGLLSDYLGRWSDSYELIISDDGSRDDGPRLVEENFADNDGIRLIRQPLNQGKGAAVRRGMLAARGELVIYTDADLSYPVETIGDCVESLQEFDVVAGSRDLPGSDIEVTPSLPRRLTGPVFKGLVRKLVLDGFTDTQCGFKGFRSQAVHEIFLNCTIDGFAFDVEVLALARFFGYRIKEMPVRLVEDYSDSRINLTTDPLRMAAELLLIRRRVRELERELAREG